MGIKSVVLINVVCGFHFQEEMLRDKMQASCILLNCVPPGAFIHTLLQKNPKLHAKRARPSKATPCLDCS